MIADLKPYPAMKDSGVEWLGEVPEHWEVLPNRVLFDEIKDRDHPGEQMLSVTIKRGIIKQASLLEDTSKKDSSNLDRSNYKFLQPGDIAYNKMRAWQGAIGASRHYGIISPAYVVQRPREGGQPRYFHHLFRTPQFAKEAERWSYGITSDMWSLRPEHFKLIYTCLAPLPEQAAIVRYLDHVDGRVQRPTRAKRRLIGLLTEQKQAIIHRAVTRGLDPDVPLKDSGVEWLGDVPEHWEVRRNGRLFAQRNETGFADLPILEVSLRTGIRIRDFENSVRKQVMSDRDKYKRARTGDIAYNTMRMWQGAVGIAPTDGLISPAYVIARPLPGTVSRYFEMLFRTSVYMREVDSYSRGIVKDRNRLYWEDFKAMPSCYPPPPEQAAIVEYLDQATADIDTTISRAEREIELLGEYRTRLISDVVTGKLDVRDAAAALPEVDLLAEEEDTDDLYADLDLDTEELDEALEELEA